MEGRDALQWAQRGAEWASFVLEWSLDHCGLCHIEHLCCQRQALLADPIMLMLKRRASCSQVEATGTLGPDFYRLSCFLGLWCHDGIQRVLGILVHQDVTNGFSFGLVDSTRRDCELLMFRTFGHAILMIRIRARVTFDNGRKWCCCFCAGHLFLFRCCSWSC